MENPNNTRQVRTLKVYDKILTRGGRGIYNKYNKLFPEIRLIGNWLHECGFRPGMHIEVTTEQNRLTITPAWFEQGG